MPSTEDTRHRRAPHGSPSRCGCRSPAFSPSFQECQPNLRIFFDICQWLQLTPIIQYLHFLCDPKDKKCTKIELNEERVADQTVDDLISEDVK